MTVTYRVCPTLLHEHLFEVEARFSTPDALDVWMPVWTPGSYLVREYARHVQDFSASDGAGRALAWRRLDKCTWRVDRPEDGIAAVRYRVYAHDLTVRTNHLDGSHGYFNGAALFVTSDRHRAEPCRLVLDLPAGWRAFCALPESEGARMARTYDELVDSPVEMGPHRTFSFVAAGKPHDVVVWGEGNVEPGTLARDLKTVCETEARIFGGVPFDRYLFILLLTDKGRGGLEHASSCTLLWPRLGFRPRERREELLSLAAHEYFHLWNIKRIIPRAFLPFDYRRESYTELLWAMEGITSYYDTLVLRRAGILGAADTLTRLGEVLTAVESTPGRRLLTLADASRLAWIKHYRPDESSPNNAVSYYAKGEIVAALLDLEIRHRTRGTRSLDDLMRLLLTRFGDGSGVPEDGVEKAASEVAESDLSLFFDRAIRSTEELDDGIFGHAGLELRRCAKRNPSDKGGTPAGPREEGKPWLGIDLRPGERTIVATTFTGSPAAAAGLSPDDEIVAFNGLRATPSSLAELIEDHGPGETVRLTLFRRDQLLEIEARLAPQPLTACWLEKKPDATAAQRALYQAWLGEPFALPGRPEPIHPTRP